MKQSIKKARQGGFTLIEILIVIGIIAVLAAIVLVAINPVRLFNKADDSQRWNDVNAILSAVGQDIVENRGTINGQITTTVRNISSGGANLCGVLVPNHMASLPRDPNAGAAFATCPTTYDTNYTIVRDAAGHITVTAPDTEVETPDITVTR